jgi:hypothetical protein
VLESPLIRQAGPIAFVAGGLFAVIHVGQFLAADRSDLVAVTIDPVFVVFSAAYFRAFPLMLFALVTVYTPQSRAHPAGVVGRGRRAGRSSRAPIARRSTST